MNISDSEGNEINNGWFELLINDNSMFGKINQQTFNNDYISLIFCYETKLNAPNHLTIKIENNNEFSLIITNTDENKNSL